MVTAGFSLPLNRFGDGEQHDAVVDRVQAVAGGGDDEVIAGAPVPSGRTMLDARLDPKEIARLLGTRAGLDYGEMRAIWSVAVQIQQGRAAPFSN